MKAIKNEGDKKSRNSVLLCFVLSFESLWKALKYLLIEQEGLEAASPKEALRQAYQLSLLGLDDRLWLAMSDDRNLVAHTYNEQQAQAIYERVLQYHPAYEQLVQTLQSKYPSLFSES